MKLTCLVVCFVYVQLSSAGSNHISGGFVKNNLENFKSCALNVNLTCLEMLVRSKIYELNHANEIRVLDNVVIEKLDSAGDTSLYQQRAVGKDWMRDVTHFISNRALKVNLWDMINMRLSKSLQNPENVQVSFGLTPDIERLGKKIKRKYLMHIYFRMKYIVLL